MDWISRHAAEAYGVVFAAAFVAVAVWQSNRPLQHVAGVKRRWMHHGILFAISTLVVAVFMRVGPVAAAWVAQANPFGVLGKLPLVMAIPLGVALIDLIRYATHRAFHRVSWLWLVHSVHHTDKDYDVSTAVRFHPFELLLTRAATVAGIFIFAPPISAVLVSEFLTVVSNLVAHANASFPPAVERVVRSVFVTPEMHRLHHSIDEAHQRANFGQTFLVWDRLFGTYLAPVQAGKPLPTGVAAAESADTLSMAHLFGSPFGLG